MNPSQQETPAGTPSPHAPRMQFSLANLFALVTCFAVYCVLGYLVQWQPITFGYLSVLTTLCGLLIFAGFFRKPMWLLVAAVLQFLFLLPFRFEAAILFAVTLISLFAFMKFGAVAKRNFYSSLLATCFLLIIAFAGLTAFPSADYRNAQELRELYPVRDLSDRLQGLDYKEPIDSTQLSTTVAKNLAEEDDWYRKQSGNWRTFRLANVHDIYEDQFVRAFGFGVRRMIAPSKQSLLLPPLEDIPFRSTGWQSRAAEDLQHQFNFNPWSIVDTPEFDSPQENARPQNLESMYRNSVRDFLHPTGFGYTETWQQAIGFVPHAAHQPIDPRESSGRQLESVELITLIRFDQPRAFVLDHLPRMDQLQGDQVPTRPLDSFELAAIEQLRYERDIVMDTGSSQTQMVGSLRAHDACLTCHTTTRGTLLGALSYRFSHLPK